MSTVSHAPRQPVKELLSALHTRFGQNIDEIEKYASSDLELIDLNSRVISEIREILVSGSCESESQKRICAELLDEVFSDFSLAMYLCSIGLIVPARMSARRAIELGLASVYMWDLPHEYWGWRHRNQDHSFSAMVAHLNTVGYLEYMTQLHEIESSTPICDQGKFQDLYRKLSDTVHGKNTELPPLSPERFTPAKNSISNHFRLIADAQAAIIELLFGRFSGLQQRVEEIFPQLRRA